MTAYTAPLDDMRFVLYEVFDADNCSPNCRATRSMGQTWSTPCSRKRASSANRAAAAQPLRRRGGLPLRERRRPHAEGLQGSLRGSPGRLDRAAPAIPNTAARACRKWSTSLVEEMICSANLSFGMYPGLSPRRLQRAARCTAPRS